MLPPQLTLQQKSLDSNPARKLDVPKVCQSVSGLPGFSWYKTPKRENILNDQKYTKWQRNIPNDQKIYQMATKYTK
jgi:hypothetical protein